MNRRYAFHCVHLKTLHKALLSVYEMKDNKQIKQEIGMTGADTGR